MSDYPDNRSQFGEDDLEIDQAKLRRIRERVLKAEKEKLHLDNPRGVVNDIEDIVREEMN
jgi:hypothetical protein